MIYLDLLCSECCSLKFCGDLIRLAIYVQMLMISVKSDVWQVTGVQVDFYCRHKTRQLYRRSYYRVHYDEFKKNSKGFKTALVVGLFGLRGVYCEIYWLKNLNSLPSCHSILVCLLDSQADQELDRFIIRVQVFFFSYAFD